MFFRQIYEEGLAQASYLVGCPDCEEAIVVDPRRDIDIYLETAEENDLKIVGVTETHIHADFVSGARELAAATGATFYYSDEGGAAWRYRSLPDGRATPVSHGHVLRFGQVELRVIHTPGHTPEHLTFVITDRAVSSEPMIALTGDFMFVGDLGRPDLLEAVVGVAGSAESGARDMFASLRDRFSSIPDFVQIWPGHGAGSACGKALGAVPASTVGYERLTAWWAPFVARNDENGFVRELLDGQPDPALYFARMKRLNRDGAPILGRLPRPERLDAAALKSMMKSGAILIDSRQKERFRVGHATGAISIPDASTFATRAAWFVGEGERIVLVARPDRVEALTRALVRVGLDDVAGYVDETVIDADRDLRSATLGYIDIEQLEAQRGNSDGLILDVRNAHEYRSGHIPGALHVPASRLVGALDELPRDRPVYVHCAGGGRSNSAASALLAHGFNDVFDVAGGFSAWQEMGKEVETGDPPRKAAAVG